MTPQSLRGNSKLVLRPNYRFRFRWVRLTQISNA